MGLFTKKEKKIISKVRVLGVRTAENTGFWATYNSAVYCIVVEYTDGSRALDEVDGKEMGQYLAYIDMDI